MGEWRKNLRAVEPYIPGEQPKQEDMIKLNTNENPYPPAPGVEKILKSMETGDFRLYPKPDARELVDALAEEYKVPANQVFVGVGSDDVLGMAFLTCFNSKKPVLFPDITYSFYPVWADLFKIPYNRPALDENFCIKKEDYAGAVEYYKQALTMVDNEEDKADYLYRMANVYVAMKNYQQGATIAQQALDINAEDGRCYLLLGICYASAKIYDDPILARSVFWVACDMFRKAKSVDSSCASDANKLIATYSQYFPSKEDVFFHRDLNEGAPFRVGGWIGKTTTCRSKAE